MADSFSDCEGKELQQFKENAEERRWVGDWAEEKRIHPREAKELDKNLQKFFAEVRKKDGSDYEPDSLRVIITSLERLFLWETGSSISIAKYRDFVNSRKVLEGKACSILEQGYGQTSTDH